MYVDGCCVFAFYNKIYYKIEDYFKQPLIQIQVTKLPMVNITYLHRLYFVNRNGFRPVSDAAISRPIFLPPHFGSLPSPLFSGLKGKNHIKCV